MTPGPPRHQSIPEMFLDRCARWPELRGFFTRTAPGQWEGIPLAEAARDVEALAAGLLARGIGPGTTAAIYSYNRREWQLLDLAIQMTGALSVPIYMNSTPEQAGYILRHAGCKLVFTDTPERTAMVEALELPALESIVPLERFGELRDASEAGRAAAREALGRIAGGDPATISYTSGTTGEPKGVVLSHHNILFGVEAAGQIVPHCQPGEASLSYLPLAHIAQRMLDLVCLEQGVALHYAPSIEELPQALQEVRPQILLAVPRVLEKVHQRIAQAVEQKGAVARAVLARAVAAGDAFYAARAHRHYPPFRDTLQPPPGPPPLLLRLRHALWDRLFYRKVRAAFGGRLRLIVAGSAPLEESLGRFYYGCRLPIYEVYGLTETAGALTAGTDQALCYGTVNRPIPLTEVRTAEDGEILARGPGIFDGYYRDPAATAAAIDVGGWFHTGDLGRFDEAGDLRITGRKKELIVTAAGKNIAPIPIEQKLAAHPAIDQAVVIGDRRPYLVALLFVTPGADLESIERHVQSVNATLPRVETIKRHAVFDAPLAVETGELTPTLKLRRAVVAARHAERIDALYQNFVNR